MKNLTIKLLIIDEELSVVKPLTEYFEGKEYIIDSASNGKEGLKKVKEFKPDIILLDIVLPKMDGYKVLKELKSDPKTKDILTIVLTNLDAKESILKVLKEGGYEYLIKAHYSLEELGKKVEEIYKENK